MACQGGKAGRSRSRRCQTDGTRYCISVRESLIEKPYGLEVDRNDYHSCSLADSWIYRLVPLMLDVEKVNQELWTIKRSLRNTPVNADMT